MIFTGFHTPGKNRGQSLGYPTINLNKINTVLIENGVYAAWVTIATTRFKAALFIGESPTFKDKDKTVELHLIGVSENEIKQYKRANLIPSKITVEIARFIRSVMKFNSRDALITQIGEDVKQILTVLQ